MDAVAEPDHAALAKAYRQHGSRVHALARGLCGVTRAEDLTQEVFLQLWNYPQRFNAERGSLRSYLLMQVHRRAVDILRSDNARAARESAQNLRANAERRDSEALALTLLERAELDALVSALTLLERAELDPLVSALPANERYPIVLAYFGGYTYSDVARLLALPEVTIKSRVRTGLKRLRVEGAPRLHLP